MYIHVLYMYIYLQKFFQWFISISGIFEHFNSRVEVSAVLSVVGEFFLLGGGGGGGRGGEGEGEGERGGGGGGGGEGESDERWRTEGVEAEEEMRNGGRKAGRRD